MKTVSILIPNRNSFEAVQLAIESIRRYTDYPHRIIVFDDFSTNGIDIPYLENAKAKGWIELYRGKKHAGHGSALNQLVNDICDTDYAAIIDSDIEVKCSGWIQDFLSIVSTDKEIIAAVDTIEKRMTWRGYNVPVSNFSFGFINMKAYRDSMEVDWRSIIGGTDRREKPYCSIFADIYPPENRFKDLVTFDENFVSVDPGAKFWLKVNYFNSKSYRIIPIPYILLNKYHHFDHISFISIPDPSYPPHIAEKRKLKFSLIKNHLKELRCQN